MCKELVDLIDRAGWKAGSYKAVAERMGISPTRWSDIKRRTKKPSTLNICQLADIAELNVVETLF
jgi:transcriptional regulator with XRE-family HTH domain